MIVCAILLGVLQAAPAVTPVAVPPPTMLGLTDEDVVVVVDQLGSDLQAVGASMVTIPALEDACRVDDACLSSTVQKSEAPLLLLLAFTRVGDELDVEEVIATATEVGRRQRTISMAHLAGAMLSPEAQLVLADLPATSTSTSPSPSPSASTSSASLGPAGGAPPIGLVTTLAGGALLGVGLVAFGFDAATLEDPTSAGVDKDRARTTGGIFLGAAVIGATAVGVGVGLLLFEGEEPTTAQP